MCQWSSPFEWKEAIGRAFEGRTSWKAGGLASGRAGGLLSCKGWQTDGSTEGRPNERTDGHTDIRTNGQTDGRTDRRTD